MNEHLWIRRVKLFAWRIFRCRKCGTYVFTKRHHSRFLSESDCPR